ncbi:hypothetical protein I4U23_022527 [Adineta vaga]|nr:hypothetical protein I4U23_022527 [Adineta vaga]
MALIGGLSIGLSTIVLHTIVIPTIVNAGFPFYIADATVDILSAFSLISEALAKGLAPAILQLSSVITQYTVNKAKDEDSEVSPGFTLKPNVDLSANLISRNVSLTHGIQPVTKCYLKTGFNFNMRRKDNFAESGVLGNSFLPRSGFYKSRGVYDFEYCPRGS